ncbi:MAG TPA: UbiA family prenyltransferase [Pyrinomonadaceae bacterium]|nr:UbiA family prenyltransferase [Pyrinomonadaceae bacterium]
MSLRAPTSNISAAEATSGVATSGGLMSLIKALRVHQWIKNVLVFVPLLMAHRIFDTASLVRAVYALVAWCLCASGIYLLNDVFDLKTDRLHPRKKHRPFAAGTISTTTVWILIPLLMIAGLAIGFLLLPEPFGLALVLYLALTTAYSMYLKQLLMVDVLVLAGLYTLRVLSGGFATGIPVSPWLLAFSMFLFLSLAFVKRYTELRAVTPESVPLASRRNYGVEDTELLKNFGTVSGYLSVLVLVLYINSKEVVSLYRQPTILWLVGPCLLYWITRVWLLAHRGKMHDDPIVFTVKDPASYVVGLMVVAVVVAATLW